MAQAIILSGGKGTRLRPLTDNTPKPMLEIGGKPHLEHIVTSLKNHGITDIIFSTGYLHKKIVEHFGDGSKFGVAIQYREDGEIPLGTGGAIRNCEDLITSYSFLVINGDILTDMDYIPMIKQHMLGPMSNDRITIALTPVEDPSSYGVAVVEKAHGRISHFVEKPSTLEFGNLINTGIYVMDKSVLNVIPKEKFVMLEDDVFPLYANLGNLFGHTYNDIYWIDIGTHVRYNKANEDIVTGAIKI